MTIKEILIEQGYTEEMKNAQEVGSAYGTNWRDRPKFRLSNGKLQYCEFRCISSHYFGGNCQCVNHRPESWIDI